ncbi:MAG: hypothetical protein AW09_002463 [Candidatus Accumulibacter phosphatis]|uniref:Uncharacterized protein n=1 Tax=Candidatus Accumulibacter phosphatis TaxID=327160 RepID=A0A080LUR0_9PROT|nr:MAG: hypothetical protein AW09_002463 [Candidatus Accumulibacter phosphatis]
MRERQRREFDVHGGKGCNEVGVAHAIADRRQRRRIVEVGDDDRPGDAGDLCGDFGVFGHAIDRFAVVPVAVNAEQDLGFDLPETVENALDTEVGRSRRPDRTERSGGEHRDQRLGQVRQVSGDTIALADTGGLQGLHAARDLRVKLGVREATPALVFAPEYQRVGVGPGGMVAQQVLGIVQPGLWKPVGTGHPFAVFEHRRAALAEHAALLP